VISVGVNCDICGAQRTASNHWFLLMPVTTLPISAKGEFGRSIEALFALFPWDDAEASKSDTRHICGSSCATKALSAALGKASEEPAELAAQ
jgi:hypothetical protein